MGVGSCSGLISGETEGERSRSKKRTVLDEPPDDEVTLGPQTTSTCNEVGVAVTEWNGDRHSSSVVRTGLVNMFRMGP